MAQLAHQRIYFETLRATWLFSRHRAEYFLRAESTCKRFKQQPKDLVFKTTYHHCSYHRRANDASVVMMRLQITLIAVFIGFPVVRLNVHL